MSEIAESCILLFVKYPVAGRVKSRLARGLGSETAAELYKRFVGDTIKMLGAAGRDLKIYCDPCKSVANYAEWIGGGHEFIHQVGGDIGERMRGAFEETFAAGFKRAVLIGSDIPDMPAEFISRAFAGLDGSDAILGPSADGGYYLIGFSEESFCAEAFSGVSWSTESVLSQTRERLESNGVKAALLPMWGDVDTIDDLKELVERNKGGEFENSRTMEFVSANDLTDIEGN
jgi:hypothetical protein